MDKKIKYDESNIEKGDSIFEDEGFTTPSGLRAIKKKEGE
jgi:hypothetical protein